MPRLAVQETVQFVGDFFIVKRNRVGVVAKRICGIPVAKAGLGL